MVLIRDNIRDNIRKSIRDNIQPRSFFDLYGGASAGYSLYDLGNRRGTVTETGETVYGDFEEFRYTFDSDKEGFSDTGGGSPSVSWDSSENALLVSLTSAGNGGTQKTETVFVAGKKSRVSMRLKAVSGDNPLTVQIRTTNTWDYTDIDHSTNLTPVGFNNGYRISTLDGEWTDVWFEAETISAGSASLYIQALASSPSSFLVDDIVITELDTYRTLDVTYSNPAVRLRRDSDNIHKSFPAGAFTQMQNWANEDVNMIANQFKNGDFLDTSIDWNNSIGTATLDAVNNRMTVDVPASGNAVNLNVDDDLVGMPTTGAKIRYTIDVESLDLDGATSLRLVSSSTIIKDITTTGVLTGEATVINFGTSLWLQVQGTPTTNLQAVFNSIKLEVIEANAYATTWYDQSGVQVESVSIDDDASVDNTADWDITDGTLSFDTDHYVVTWVANTQWSVDNTNSVPMVDGEWYRLRVDVKSGTGGDVAIGFGRVNSTNTSQTTIDTSVGTSSSSWSTIELYWQADLSVGALNNLPTLFTQLTSGTLLFRNWKVEQLDKAHNDATQTTADNQPKVVDAGVLVTDANGNYSLSFDGVDDSLVVVNLVNEFENTDFQLTAVGSNVYAGLVSGSVPRLYFRDTAYSYDALSIITYTNPALAIQTWECVGSAHEVFHDGSSVGTATQAQTAFGPTDFAVGQSAAAYRDTNISALLFYASDQSTNRSAIEQSLSNILTTPLS